MSSDSPADRTLSTAVVVHAPGDLRVERIPVAPPSPDAALVRIAFGGICGSDVSYWTKGVAGESVLREPLVLGHEVVGTVLQAARDGSGPTPGTAVAVHPATPGPGQVPYPPDRPNLSPGCTYLGSAAHLPHTQGAFAEIAVLPTRMLRPLPAGLTLRTAVLAEPASVAWHAVARAGDVRGGRVLVVGSGPIGALTVAVAKRAGATDVVTTDTHDAALRLGRRLGATRTLRAGAPELDALAADVVFECSGSAAGLATAIRAAARGGRVVMVGLLPPGDQPLPLSLAITRELELMGSFRFNDELDEVLPALADGSLDVDGVIAAEFDAQEAIAAFSAARDASRAGKIVLRF